MKKMSTPVRRLLLLGAMLLAAAIVVGGAGASSLQNGGFETGNLAGWSGSGSYGVVGGGAQAGSFSAVLNTGSSWAGSGSWLSQTFTVSKGQTIQGWAKWIGGDDCGWDQGFVWVNATQVWYDNNCSSQFNTWVHWSYVAPSTGDYSVTAYIENTSDNLFNSSMGFDSVSIGGGGKPTACWNADGTNGCYQSGRGAVCTANGFQNVTTSEINPDDPNVKMPAYVDGYGLVCSLTDIASSGGDPSAYHDAGYKVNEEGVRAPDGYTDSDWGAYYEFFAKNQ